ncbi:MAG: DUF1343 domain-containing protein [Bacteroidetes bacterium]|nr:DUF1343 domain-containing protein [Bacteroidota bacterium]
MKLFQSIGLAFLFFWVPSCQAQPKEKSIPISTDIPNHTTIICGAERLNEYLPLIKGKNLALLVNQTSLIGKDHLVDVLLSHHVAIKKIFAPEHGFRGGADAGEQVKDSIDAKTQIPVISLYGNKKKPSAEDLKGIDVVIFDIQDVGVRFYTFISSLHYLMEACAENNKELLVLDRPNPNGWYVDGPVLKKAFQSFVGVDPVPVVHGLTVGEYAKMVNGEKWLENGQQCRITIIPCENYEHKMRYSLPVKPSPNLPNDLSIALYPSLCFFEGTNVSVGRGTDAPFQIFGSPKTKFDGAYEFEPISKPGAKSPPLLNEKCYGYDLRNTKALVQNEFLFHYVLQMYGLYSDKDNFFLKNNFFDKLCGNDMIRKLIIEGKEEARIKESYQAELLNFKEKRKKYLLYKDF